MLVFFISSVREAFSSTLKKLMKFLLLAVLSFLCCGVFANNTKSNNEIIDIKVYPPIVRCNNNFSFSIKKALKTIYSFDDNNVTCIEKMFISNGREFHLPQQCSFISNKCHKNSEVNNKLLRQLKEISLFIKIFNSAFSHCSQVFSENSSALSGYYTMRAHNGSLISVYCDDNAFDNCSQVFKENSSALSGFYTMRSPNGSLISVYCDDNAHDNCSQVFKENSSALSAFYTIRAHNGSLISVYCNDNAFANCSQVFKENNSALSGFYTMRSPNGSLISVYCDDNVHDNCSQVFKENSSALSGFYTIRAHNGSLISVYCNDNAFANCSQVFKENSSALSGFYTMRSPNGSLISVYCDDNAFDNCSQVFKENSSALSGFYTMRSPNGSLISVYCDDNAHDNCSQVFKENSSALSGFYTIRAHNGSLISVYCNDNAFANCSQVFKENSSALSGYYTMRSLNSSLISVYCDDNAFENCSQVFKENSSALSGFYTMRSSNGSLISVYCDDNAFDNCSEVFKVNSSATSGYYTMRALNGSLIYIYCNMEGSSCDGKGGWMRIGYLNMSDVNATCPFGLIQQQHKSFSYDLCGRANPSSGGCNSVYYSTFGFNFTNVCGQVRGFQFGSTDAFHSNYRTIDSPYVHGVSITYGNNTRKHLWTYASGVFENLFASYNCPCGTSYRFDYYPSSFVGNNYYCESGNNQSSFAQKLYANDFLWDGENCNGLEVPCCTNQKMPWFHRVLNTTISDDIELRVCSDFGLPIEGTPLDIIELYIK